MKIRKFFTVLCAVLVFASCSDDDGDSTIVVDQESIIGSWDMISLNVDADFSGELLGLPVVTITNSVGENFDYTITFTEDTYNASGSYDVVTTGTLNGIPLDEERETIDDTNQRGTYEIVDGNLVIDGDLINVDDISSDLDGVELDPSFETSFASNGDLVIEQSGEVTVTEEGTTLDVSYSSRIVFRKQ